MIEYFKDSDEPIPDGKVVLLFKECPWEGDDPSHNMEFKDYKGFKFENDCFYAFHREGHTELYPMHNILYIEWHKNSPEIVAAIQKWQTAEFDKYLPGEEPEWPS